MLGERRSKEKLSPSGLWPVASPILFQGEIRGLDASRAEETLSARKEHSLGRKSWIFSLNILSFKVA